MARWNPQRYQDEGEKQGIDPGVLDAASKAIANIQAVNPSLPPILTLMHLSKVTEVNYPYLREIVGRKIDPYKSFALRKRTPGLHRTRTIHVPEDYLLTVQRWISRAILRQAAPHSASFGYHPGSSPVTAARRHRNAKWLIKIDLKDFFDNIREPAVFDVFRSLGYGSLISFEMARIVTRAPDAKRAQIAIDEHRIPFYSVDSNGFLPQGAPTSPMLSNLVMRGLDAKLQELANEHDFRYSRYADDLVFSCRDQKSRSAAQTLRDAALQALRAGGFTPNMRKTTIVAPGGRKIVLGLLGAVEVQGFFWGLFVIQAADGTICADG
ncbi:reverse transcriptase family protein, partial [Rhizobium leguminosarum]|uniref:reverse transcriptase family protein n=1 Tax=Rhizobium leguminosarum TaxID=384 RepID=UPI001440EC52